MDNKFILNLENKIHGVHTRLKELHFSAPCISLHNLIDDFDEEFLEFDDAVIVYDATNKQWEYDLIQDSINNNDSESHMFKNIKFLYLDEELEKLINGIIEPEILIQKTKKI